LVDTDTCQSVSIYRMLPLTRNDDTLGQLDNGNFILPTLLATGLKL